MMFLKVRVATEAFLVVNCGVWVSDPKFSLADVNELNRRISVEQSINTDTLNNLWNQYLESVNGTSSKILPYLALIRKKLPDVQIKVADPFSEEFPLLGGASSERRRAGCPCEFFHIMMQLR